MQLKRVWLSLGGGETPVQMGLVRFSLYMQMQQAQDQQRKPFIFIFVAFCN